MSRVGDFARFHQHRVNLTIHIVLVPIFVLGILGAAFFLLHRRWIAAAGLGALPLLSLAVRGAGHKPNPIRPSRSEVREIL